MPYISMMKWLFNCFTECNLQGLSRNCGCFSCLVQPLCGSRGEEGATLERWMMGQVLSDWRGQRSKDPRVQHHTDFLLSLSCLSVSDYFCSSHLVPWFFCKNYFSPSVHLFIHFFLAWFCFYSFSLYTHYLHFQFCFFRSITVWLWGNKVLTQLFVFLL